MSTYHMLVGVASSIRYKAQLLKTILKVTADHGATVYIPQPHTIEDGHQAIVIQKRWQPCAM